MVSLSRELIREVQKLRYDDFPEDVVDYSKLLAIDLLGVAIGGSNSPEAMGLLRALSASGALRNDGSELWGTPHKSSAADAALFNGSIAHALELDDFGGADHSGAVVVPAMLACLSHVPAVSGKTFIEALVAGYEVCRRMLEAAGAYRAHNADGGWHSTATCGASGAAVATGLLLDLSEDELVHAFGFAATMTGGTWAFNKDGAMSKRIHPGWAAQLGVRAAFFAKAGVTGPEYSLEAEWGGFFNTYARGTTVSASLSTSF